MSTNMVRPVEVLRRITHTTEVGLPNFSPVERQGILNSAKAFVAEVKQRVPTAGVDEALFHTWMPKAEDFRRPYAMGENIHAQHNIRHAASVLAQEMFLVPYVEAVYGHNLLPNAVYASAASHDLERIHDIFGSVPDMWYQVHGRKMARAIREGDRYPNQLTPQERIVASSSVMYHDVDGRKPSDRLPEDELLAIVDRSELVRIIHGIGPVAKAGQLLRRVAGTNPFEHRVYKKYEPYYFPGLIEKMQPLSQAILILSLEGIKQGMSQKDSVVYAIQQLGMEKSAQQQAAA